MQNAFVLHRRRFSNSSLIIEIFSQTAGRVTILSKGALASRRFLAGTLQAFTPLSLEYVGRGQIKTLTYVEATHLPFSLLDDRLYCGLYINELLMRLLSKELPFISLFSLYQSTLIALSQTKLKDIDIVLRYFELGLLDELGYRLPLIYEAQSHIKIKAEQDYLFFFEKGAVPCASFEKEKIKGATLLALQNKTLSHNLQRQQAKTLLRQTLQHYLGYKPLKTRILINQIKN